MIQEAWELRKLLDVTAEKIGDFNFDLLIKMWSNLKKITIKFITLQYLKYFCIIYSVTYSSLYKTRYAYFCYIPVE